MMPVIITGILMILKGVKILPLGLSSFNKNLKVLPSLLSRYKG
jgi:hypothetical protein